MDMLKTFFKIVLGVTLLLGGVLIGGTIFTAKKIDSAADKLQEKFE